MSLLIALALAEAVTASGTGSLTITVSNVRSSKGHIVVDICPKDRFLEDGCAAHGEAPARAGTTSVTVANIPAGQYAVQAFHDENSNGDIDRAMFGIPKEGVGFSRNARIRMSPPKWQDAVFTHTGRAEVIGFDLRYFIGAKGPATTRR
jgi:uncharacterized protein (DUF2141 family)